MKSALALLLEKNKRKALHAIIVHRKSCFCYYKRVSMQNNKRLSIEDYAMALAQVAALRSEDPYRKVGAAALDVDNRVIGTAYNGLYPGFSAPVGFWDDRDERQKFMLHAEINLCSLFKRGEAVLVACTTMPCTSCMQALCAHGVKKILYREGYDKSEAPLIAEKYGVELIPIAGLETMSLSQ